jgi:hypothetical protein
LNSPNYFQSGQAIEHDSPPEAFQAIGMNSRTICVRHYLIYEMPVLHPPFSHPSREGDHESSLMGFSIALSSGSSRPQDPIRRTQITISRVRAISQADQIRISVSILPPNAFSIRSAISPPQKTILDSNSKVSKLSLSFTQSIEQPHPHFPRRKVNAIPDAVLCP